jgi:hypothetical protein
MSMGVHVKNRYMAGSCLACHQPDCENKVVEISLENVLVRVCPSCAIELRNGLTHAISRLDNMLEQL